MRVPPAVGQILIVGRVEKLIKELEEAFDTPPEPGKERKPRIEALVVMASFARDVGCSRDVVGGLSDLAYSLQDLDAGRAAPVVQPTKPERNPGGNSGDSSVTWIKRVRVLVALHALQRADPDLKQEEAAKHIAKKFPRLHRLMTRGKNLPGTILRWRRDLEEAKSGEFLAQFYEQMDDMKKFVAQQALNPDQLRNFAYNALARI